MKYHPLLLAASIRFLTKQTGQNVYAGVGSQLSTMKAYVKAEVLKVDTKATTEIKRVDTKANLNTT